MHQFEQLFAPIQIGTVTIANRIMNTAHNVGLTTDFLPDDRMVAYYREKAQGGCGLIVMGAAHVHSSSPAAAGHVCNQSDDIIPWYSKIASAVHEFPCKVFAQLTHMGRLAKPLAESFVVAPSAVREDRFRSMPKILEPEEITDIVTGFANAARRARAGGLDGIELQGAHGYLIMGFMSPLSNKRGDQYGGSLENRLRFVRETIGAVREQVGPDFVVGIRLSGDELIDGGLTLEDMKIIARMLEQDGQLDYFNISASNHGYPLGWALHMGPAGTPAGNLVPLARGIKEIVGLPVGCVGRITTPEFAEQIVSTGDADLVGMARALIADPAWPKKARLGQLDDIRPCVGDLFCAARRDQRLPIRCIYNPVAGREQEWATMDKTSAPQQVMIIGGGPAGLETARLAALRGHQVTLYEQKTELGGQIQLGRQLPTREELGNIVHYLIRQIKKLGVDLKLKTQVTPQLIDQLHPDVIVIATGSRPLQGNFSGAEQAHVLSCRDVLEKNLELGQHVVVIDDEDGYAGLGVAEFLADQGKVVRIVSKGLYVGSEIEGKTRVLLYRRLLNKGVEFITNTWVSKVDGPTLVVHNVYTQKEGVIPDVNHIVYSLGGQANDELYFALKGRYENLYRIGDCVAPRQIQHAIFEGHRVGRLI